MADKTISQLSAATTPLTGTEILPIVQGGVTKQVAVSKLTQLNGYTMPVNLVTCSIPFVLLSSGTMGNNGALSGITATNRAYPASYVYLPANAIASGSASGWYYAVFSSTTTATVYNNVYSTGNPVAIASPTPFSTTGPGAYTGQSGSFTTGPLFTLAANTLTANSKLYFSYIIACNNNANSKASQVTFGSANIGAGTHTSRTNNYATGMMANLGVTNLQSSVGQAVAGGLSTSPYTTIDCTASQTLGFNLFMATATDTITVESFSVQLYP